MKRGFILLVTCPLVLAAVGCTDPAIEATHSAGALFVPELGASEPAAPIASEDAEAPVASAAMPASEPVTPAALSAAVEAPASAPTPPSVPSESAAPAAAAPQAEARADEPLTIYSGVYSSTQAKRGNDIQQRECSACHTPTDWAQGRVLQAYAGRSAYDLIAQLQATMPMDGPGRLSWQEYTDIVAYMFELNAVPAGGDELASDEGYLRTVRLEYRR